MARDYRSNVGQQSQDNLMEALGKLQQAGQFQQTQGDKFKMAGYEHQLAADTDRKKQLTKQEIDKQNLQQLLDASKNGQLPQGAGATLDGASLTRQPNLGVYDLKRQQQDTQQVNKYATALKPTSDFLGAAQELEQVTNRDGKGGVFTNPTAQLKSAGKLASMAGDSIIGYGGLMGMIDPDAAAERKAITRYNQAVGVALGGARGMSPMIQQGIKQSMGQIASGDPDLMSKALRGSARGIGQVVRTAQSGFSPDIRNQAHNNAQMDDPINFFNQITPEAGPAANLKSPPAGTDQQIKQSLDSKKAPQQAPVAPAAPGGFDPDKYLGK